MKKNADKTHEPSIGEKMELYGSLAGFIVDFLTTLLSFSQLKYWLGNKTELKKKLREVFSVVDEFAEIRQNWQDFYKNHFGWDVDFSMVLIPQKPTEGNWRLIFIPKGMTLNFAFQICEKLFTSWKVYDDLDKKVTINIRNTENHYAIWVRDEVEPDKEFLGQSTHQADSDMKIGVTLLERILFEVKYFTETGNHLDVKGVTFCSGSRDAVGYVPDAYLIYGGEFKVSYCGIGYSNSEYGIRRAVVF